MDNSSESRSVSIGGIYFVTFLGFISFYCVAHGMPLKFPLCIVAVGLGRMLLYSDFRNRFPSSLAIVMALAFIAWLVMTGRI